MSHTQMAAAGLAEVAASVLVARSPAARAGSGPPAGRGAAAPGAVDKAPGPGIRGGSGGLSPPL